MKSLIYISFDKCDLPSQLSFVPRSDVVLVTLHIYTENKKYFETEPLR